MVITAKPRSGDVISLIVIVRSVFKNERVVYTSNKCDMTYKIHKLSYYTFFFTCMELKFYDITFFTTVPMCFTRVRQPFYHGNLNQFPPTVVCK